MSSGPSLRTELTAFDTVTSVRPCGAAPSRPSAVAASTEGSSHVDQPSAATITGWRSCRGPITGSSAGGPPVTTVIETSQR